MVKIPFLRPNLVKKDAFQQYLSQMEQSKIYSNYGPINTLFEERVVNEYYGGKGAVVTVNNATIGLMLAINQLKRKKGTIAIMPSFTFSATPLAAIWCGLEPYFIDIDPEDWCMNQKLVQEAIEKLGDKVAIVIPYATFGTALDITYYQKLHESGTPVVFDAAPSFGTFHSNQSFGSGFPGCVVYSFHATKSFGIGEGGMIYSADCELINEIKRNGNFGFSAKRETISQGLNSKLSEFSAAVALATLDVYPDKINERQQIYQWYLECFDQYSFFSKGWEIQKITGTVAHQFMPILCPHGERNDQYVQLLADNDIEARTYFSPTCHQQHLFKKYNHTNLDVTNNLSERVLSLPLWEGMNKEEIKRITQVLSKGLSI